MRTLTDEEKERLMNELIKSIQMQHIKFSYELTMQEFVEKCGMSEGFAKKFLKQQIQEGKMVKRKVTIDGKTFVVYSVI